MGRLRCLEDQQAHLDHLHIYEVEFVKKLGRVRSLQMHRVYLDLRVVGIGHPTVVTHHLVAHPSLVVVAFESPMGSVGLAGWMVAPMSPKVVEGMLVRSFPMVSKDHSRPNLMLEDREQWHWKG